MEEQFKEELRALLEKYNVVMSIEEVWDDRGGYLSNVNFYRFVKGDDENNFDWNTPGE